MIFIAVDVETPISMRDLGRLKRNGCMTGSSRPARCYKETEDSKQLRLTDPMLPSLTPRGQTVGATEQIWTETR